MATEQINNAPDKSIYDIIAELRASVKDKVPGADDVQTTQIIHELVAGGVK